MAGVFVCKCALGIKHKGKKSNQKIKAGFPEMMTSGLSLQKKKKKKRSGVKQGDKVISGTKKTCIKITKQSKFRRVQVIGMTDKSFMCE